MKKIALLVVLLVSFVAFAADTPPQRPQGQRGGFMTVVDTNKDGKISKAELDAWFVKADANKDGVVDQEEFRATMPQMGPRGQGRGPGGPAPQ